MRLPKETNLEILEVISHTENPFQGTWRATTFEDLAPGVIYRLIDNSGTAHHPAVCLEYPEGAPNVKSVPLRVAKVTIQPNEACVSCGGLPGHMWSLTGDRRLCRVCYTKEAPIRQAQLDQEI